MKKVILFCSSILVLFILITIFIYFRSSNVDIQSHNFEQLKSASGDYILVQEEKKDKYGVDGYSFIIKSTKNLKDVYKDDDDYFSKNSRFLLSWSDDEDIVWVYSGDVGLYYWTLNSEDNTWKKQLLSQNTENPPSLPKVFKKELAESSISKILKERGQWK
ncbi:hypothetical protein UAY_03360 [Enterococcus moraviensis ATCC BAA-383]|uniref:Uncharacterized protein n=1 Tax=Enterococcus moraviensis ATCC BAA-383 TaxID=1158609 RepID=R2T6R5_9ENTE|nr:hypothetical protein [Enterococcus moraviensis]EOH95934.1 hypothetical protein UAY_03360 [Enterococcus moraviensis ATCC BAA-383]EOT66421.1 hypothetical protein I586_02692 [Enterococcus moraviensis ATCC BAA-383]OJG64308.1 hypothetical protein RV09_GL001871 [Enterococcus moraviensis]